MSKTGYRGHEYKRWTHESLRPLHARWLGGESLDFIAKSVQTTRGRLRGAFRYYDLNSTPGKGPSLRLRLGRPSDYDSNHVVSESWKRQDFDAIAHRSARHYKGTFEL